MEVEHCIQADAEEIRKFFHRINKTVDKSSPDGMAGVVPAEQAAKRTAQVCQRRRRYIYYTLNVLRPRYFQRKAQDYLMEHPKSTWNKFSAQLINIDVSYQVSASFLNDEKTEQSSNGLFGTRITKTSN